MALVMSSDPPPFTVAQFRMWTVGAVVSPMMSTLAALPDPAKSRSERRTGLDRGRGRPGEKCADGDDEPDDQQGAERFLDEPNKRVEQGGGGVTGQRGGRHAVQIDGPEQSQAEAEDGHGRGEAKAGADQGPPVAPGDVHP